MNWKDNNASPTFCSVLFVGNCNNSFQNKSIQYKNKQLKMRIFVSVSKFVVYPR